MEINNPKNKIQKVQPKHPKGPKNIENRLIAINNLEENLKHKFKTNYIRTTKYTKFTFLPLSLMYQFMRFSNIYFLTVTILQCISIISPLNPITAINPMVFVLTLSMLREGFEDYSRYKSDLQ